MDKKHKKKLRRAVKKKKEKTAAQEAQNKMKKQMGMFDRLPDHCLSCTKEFDKKDKSMVMAWSGVVREKEGVVRLYCPDCWQKAIDVVEALKNEDSNNGA